ncbi:MAG: hypothetical protein Q9200_005157 [Gallowayella weberi]
MRDTAERFNRNNRIVRHQASPVPADELATANLNAAFPAFSGVQKAAGVRFAPDPQNLESPLSHSKAAQSAQSKGKAAVSRGEREFTPSLRSGCAREDDASVVSDNGPAYYSDSECASPPTPTLSQLSLALGGSDCWYPSPEVVKVSNTRFGCINNPKTRQGPQPDMYKSAPGLLQTDAAAASPDVWQKLAFNDHGSLTSMPHGSTQSTLNLPQGPNLTAVFDGARRGRDPSGDSRYKAASKVAEAAKSKANEMPVPARERYLLRAIDNLVLINDDLNKEMDTMDATQITLEQKVREHEAEMKKMQERRDSGVDSAGSGDDKRNRKVSSAASQRMEIDRLEIEKKRLTTAYWDLTQQRDDLRVELSKCQTAADDLQKQRDMLKQQLADAKADTARMECHKDVGERLRKRSEEELQRAESKNKVLAQDIDFVREENAELRAQVAVLRQDVVRIENAQLRAQVAYLRQDPSANTDATPDNSRLEHADADDEGPMDMDSGALMNAQPDAQQNKRGAEQQQSVHSKVPSCESSQNFTYISNAGVRKSDLVRNNIEHGRKVRRQPQQADASKSPVADMVSVPKTKPDVSNTHARHSSDSSTSTTIIKRHSSQTMTTFPYMEERRIARIADNARRAGVRAGVAANDARRAVVRAGAAAAAASLAPAVAATTSLPPLEMAPFDPAAAPLAANLPPLEMAPLTVVQPETQPSDIPLEQPRQTHEPAKLPIVSDEELDITVYNFEPTEAPKPSPAAALTAVLESVQAERASQQVQLAKYQSNYNRQDINQRQRKQLYAKIIALTESIDCKADQIHNLHDLLVCQERNGQSMTQNQVDNTLQSLGLAAPWEGIASSTATSRRRSTDSSN